MATLSLSARGVAPPPSVAASAQRGARARTLRDAAVACMVALAAKPAPAAAEAAPAAADAAPAAAEAAPGADAPTVESLVFELTEALERQAVPKCSPEVSAVLDKIYDTVYCAGKCIPEPELPPHIASIPTVTSEEVPAGLYFERFFKLSGGRAWVITEMGERLEVAALSGLAVFQADADPGAQLKVKKIYCKLGGKCFVKEQGDTAWAPLAADKFAR